MYFINSLWESILLKQLAAVFFVRIVFARKFRDARLFVAKFRDVLVFVGKFIDVLLFVREFKEVLLFIRKFQNVRKELRRNNTRHVTFRRNFFQMLVFAAKIASVILRRRHRTALRWGHKYCFNKHSMALEWQSKNSPLPCPYSTFGLLKYLNFRV